MTFTVVEVGNWFSNLSMFATDNEAHLVRPQCFYSLVRDLAINPFPDIEHDSRITQPRF